MRQRGCGTEFESEQLRINCIFKSRKKKAKKDRDEGTLSKDPSDRRQVDRSVGRSVALLVSGLLRIKMRGR